MKAGEAKVKIAQYLRYKKQFPVVAFEAVCFGKNGQSDILSLDTKRYLHDVEIKLSIADLRVEINKPKHMYLYIAYYGFALVKDNIQKRKMWRKEWFYQERYSGQFNRPIAENHTKYFYFAVPSDILKDAEIVLEKLYPYAGLYEIKNNYLSDGYYISVIKKAHAFDVERLSLKRVTTLVKGMSATLVRVSAKAEGVHLI